MVIWLFFLCIPKERPEHEQFKFLQLVGFAFQTIGTLMFNEIVAIPFLGLDKNLFSR